MLRFLADENFNFDIVSGLLRRKPELDIVRVQEMDLEETSDRALLKLAAQEGRVLPTHDRKTMLRHVGDRVQANQPMPGVFVTRRGLSVAKRLRTFSYWPNAASKANGKGR